MYINTNCFQTDKSSENPFLIKPPIEVLNGHFNKDFDILFGHTSNEGYFLNPQVLRNVSDSMAKLDTKFHCNTPLDQFNKVLKYGTKVSKR